MRLMLQNISKLIFVNIDSLNIYQHLFDNINKKIYTHIEEIVFSYFFFWNIRKMPNYTLNNIVDIILILGKYSCNYQEAIELYSFPDNIQMIEPLHDLCCINDNIQFKNDKDVILIYPKKMIRKLLQYQL